MTLRTPMDLASLDIDRLKEIALRAGEAVMAVYQSEFAVEHKDDRSPLTEADRRSNEVILAGLKETWPEVPVISEETKALPWQERRDWEWFWLVDPLDGTKEFIKRNGEFTVNIALVHQGVPVAGVVGQPVTGRLYWAVSGRGAWRISADSEEPVRIGGSRHYRELDHVSVVGSRSHLSPEVGAFVQGLEEEGKVVTFRSSGSSLKLCLVAEGAADVYPRLGPTMEWDTAAADAVAREAGRRVLDWETREPLRYNKENLLNPWFVVE